MNHALPKIYPKLREKFSGDVLFGESPARHVMAEFAFDVVQVARGQFKSDAYQRLIGFEVARPLLERAFRVTYGLELKDVFGDVDLAIGTYRRAASQIIPDVTRIAWREKRDEIVSVTPDVTERDFVYTMTRQEYEEAFGTGYRKPGLLVRLVVAVFKVLPTFGPFKPLAFEPLPPETERMFLDSFGASLNQDPTAASLASGGTPVIAQHGSRYRHKTSAQPQRAGRRDLRRLDQKLEKVKYAGASPGLRSALGEHYGTARRATRSASAAPRLNTSSATEAATRKNESGGSRRSGPRFRPF